MFLTAPPSQLSVLCDTRHDTCVNKELFLLFIFFGLDNFPPVLGDGDDDHAVGDHAVGEEVDHHHGLPGGPDYVGVHPQAARHDVDRVEEVAHALAALSRADCVNLGDL